MAADHQHTLQRCGDCGGEGWGCTYCDGRGYLRPEHCEVCGEPMGNARRWWKRLDRPADWWREAWRRQNPPRT